jgi:tetratricopeptide (TPR) repeat protein
MAIDRTASDAAEREKGRSPARSVSAGEVFRQATMLHREGRLAEAAQLYRTVLRVAPDHVESLHSLGFICNQVGRFADAVALFEKALAGDPNAARIHNDLGIALQGLQRQEAAVGHYRDAARLAPELIEAHNNLGNALHALGRTQEAIAAFGDALSLQPGSAEIHNNFGIALAALGHHDEAVVHYRTALAARSGFAEAHNNLGIALAALQRGEEAIAHYDRAVALNPRYAFAYANRGHARAQLGHEIEAIADYERALEIMPDRADVHASIAGILHAAGRSSEAVAQFEKALALEPNQPATHSNFGALLAALSRHAEAAAHFERALVLAPGSAEAHNNLGNALAALDRHAEAVRHYQAAVAIAPGLAAAHCNLGDSLIAVERAEEAVASYDRALAIDPRLVDAYRGRGGALLVLGSLEEARQAFETALVLAPRRADVLRSLGELRRFERGDAQLAAMEALAAEMLPDGERIHLDFALGKAYADLGDTARSFAHLAAGNALQRRQIVYDEAARLELFDRIAATFTPELIAGKQKLGDASRVPIFIVGMPRSGTTLVEQVLASHSKVFGAGEVMELIKAVDGIVGPGGPPFEYPDCVPAMTGDQLRALAARYLTALRARAPAAEHITDKLLSNFFCVGLIHLALPNARVIHLRRDPVDSCLSCYSKLFPATLPYSYDLGELGRYYRAYDRLMGHWRRVLPGEAMLEVQYESFVVDFEPQARRVLAYCGLDWDDACARFYETQRPVRTASVVQVRQPLYQSAVGRSGPYREMLGPLFDALGID